MIQAIAIAMIQAITKSIIAIAVTIIHYDWVANTPPRPCLFTHSQSHTLSVTHYLMLIL